MRVVFLHGYMFNVHSWSQAQQMLRADGIELHFFSQLQSAAESLEFLRNNRVDLLIAHLFHDVPLTAELSAAAAACTHRMGLDVEPLADFTTFSDRESRVFARYLSQIAAGNYANGIRYLAACTGYPTSYKSFFPLSLPGLFHPAAAGEGQALFQDTASYLTWRRRRGKASGPVVGLLTYYGPIVEENHDDIDALVLALEQHGFTPLCVAAEGVADGSLPFEKRYPWLDLFQDPAPEIILNLNAGRLVATAEDDHILRQLGVPVVQLLRLYQQSPEEWRQEGDNPGDAMRSMVYSLQQPEMAGVIEPIAVAATRSEYDAVSGLSVRHYLPLEENIALLCRRIQRWLRLRQLPNREKRLTIVLHNNPCKGVEATLGLAAGLDTFASLGACIRALRLAGYDVGDAPEDGQQLLQLFLDRKAISEFRWTTADEIVTKGRVLHKVTSREYAEVLAAMPEQARERVLADWGPFPGEGMVYRDGEETVLLITGLLFGKLRIMLQPKRGCYGAKCNGEVCRILHDPALSPPPHWLVSYAYIRRHADAVLHFGAHGALEFLPGKQVALSPTCFPVVSLDDLPNIYLYVLDVPSEAMIAKRRGAALLVSHLSAVRCPVGLDKDYTHMADLATQYEKAKQHGEQARVALLREALSPLLEQHGFKSPQESFIEAIDLFNRRLQRARHDAVFLRRHLLGRVPDLEERVIVMAGMLDKVGGAVPCLAQVAAWNPAESDRWAAACAVLSALIREKQNEDTACAPNFAKDADPAAYAALANWCRSVDALLKESHREIPQLLKALNGEFIEAGLCGSLLSGKSEVLPTGRNLFAADLRSMPTPAAWTVGQQLTDKLLRRYLQEEQRFPESVGVSLWSIDAFKSDGEVFCQILSLMGMRPLWAANGRVSGVAVIPLEELILELSPGERIPRPRVDVIIQTSSILRDMVPHFADLLDEAALMAGDLDEPQERNFIRKHTLERLHSLRAGLAEQLPENELRRLAGFRVFSSAPGSYGGADIGLALDASAWQNEADLAEIHVNAGGFAYGAPLSDMGGLWAGRQGSCMPRH